MNSLKTKLAIAILFVAASVSALAQSTAERERQVREVDERFAQALMNGDVKELDRILDPRVATVTSTGVVRTKAQTIAAHRTGATRVKRMAVDYEKVVLHGDTAVVSEKMHSSGMVHNQRINHWIQVTRVYVLRGKEWRMISYHSTRLNEAK